MLTKISQQTWDQLGTQLLAAAGLVITIGNQAGWWAIGSDLQQNIIGLGTIFLALIASLLYSVNSTPNRMVAAEAEKIAGAKLTQAYEDGRAHEVQRLASFNLTRDYKGDM